MSRWWTLGSVKLTLIVASCCFPIVSLLISPDTAVARLLRGIRRTTIIAILLPIVIASGLLCLIVLVVWLNDCGSCSPSSPKEEHK